MSTNTFTYRAGAELPTMTLGWNEETAQDVWTALDLSSGYTFTLTLVNTAGTIALTKTTNITGTATGVTVVWATDDLDQTVGEYQLRLRARETATSKDRDYAPARPIVINIVA